MQFAAAPFRSSGRKTWLMNLVFVRSGSNAKSRYLRGPFALASPPKILTPHKPIIPEFKKNPDP
jgi:hypothetical protein